MSEPAIIIGASLYLIVREFDIRLELGNVSSPCAAALEWDDFHGSLGTDLGSRGAGLENDSTLAASADRSLLALPYFWYFR